jgi:asparagine synthase (glutamine-hydrolysing)
MCGITGILAQPSGGFKITPAYLHSLCNTLIHRGPDGNAVWRNKPVTVGLAHARLAIIDLSAPANQPMTAADGTTTIVFNGEIYNHVALRQTLISLGHTDWLTSHSDTEVVLMAYRHWGMPECLKYLRGMFAFALWDETKQTLFMARDRAGEKPLYYTHQQGKFIFGSEIKAILADESIPREVDEEALFHYLTFLMVPPPRTLFKNICKLPAAHWAQIGLSGAVEVHSYWDALDAAADYARTNTLPTTENGWVEHLGKLVKESVQLRQEASDVPVGVFLSGGIDSSAVTALVGKHTSHGRLHSFAIGPDKSYATWNDETAYAEKVAKLVGTQHHTTRLTESDFLDILPQFIHWQDEPVADPAALPIYFLSRAATAQGLKVCQGGEGGDELFIGYEDWMKFARLESWNRRYPLPRLVKKLLYKVLLRMGRGNRFYTEYLRRAAYGEPIFWGGAEAFTAYEKQHLLSPALRQRFAGRSSYEVIAPLWKQYRAKPKHQQAFWNWCTWLELHLRLPEQLLMRADKMSMATALELRVPLLDPVLIAAVLNTPPSLRTKGGTKKYLLKRALAKVLPPEILHRKKQGLGMPLNEWMLTLYGSYARAVLQDFCTRSGYLHWPQVEKLFASGRGQHIWYLFNLALWWKHFIMQEKIEKPNHVRTRRNHPKPSREAARRAVSQMARAG